MTDNNWLSHISHYLSMNRRYVAIGYSCNKVIPFIVDINRDLEQLKQNIIERIGEEPDRCLIDPEDFEYAMDDVTEEFEDMYSTTGDDISDETWDVIKEYAHEYYVNNCQAPDRETELINSKVIQVLNPILDRHFSGSPCLDAQDTDKVLAYRLTKEQWEKVSDHHDTCPGKYISIYCGPSNINYVAEISCHV